MLMVTRRRNSRVGRREIRRIEQCSNLSRAVEATRYPGLRKIKVEVIAEARPPKNGSLEASL